MPTSLYLLVPNTPTLVSISLPAPEFPSNISRLFAAGGSDRGISHLDGAVRECFLGAARGPAMLLSGPLCPWSVPRSGPSYNSAGDRCFQEEVMWMIEIPIGVSEVRFDQDT